MEREAPVMTKILLVEDDDTISQGLRYALEQDGCALIRTATVAEARAALDRESALEFDLLLIDLGLPDGSGFDVCRYARSKGDAAVIFLTARDDELNTVFGLDMGADDYVTKPFRIRELQSRIRAVLRRHSGTAVTQLPGGVRVDTGKAEVTRGGTRVTLTALEYRLLLFFMAHPGQVLTRSQLLSGVFDAGGSFVNDNTLTVYIKRLRAKLEAPGGPTLITTVRGLGYRLEV